MSVRPTFTNAFASTSTAKNGGGTLTLNGSSQQLVAAHPQRVALYVTAPSGSAMTVRLDGGTAVAGAGIVVAAGTTEKITGYSGAVQVIGTNAGVAGFVDL